MENASYTSQRANPGIAAYALKLVEHSGFERFIIGMILVSAVLVGLETSPVLVDRYALWFEWGHDVILVVFIVEALLKMVAEAPRPQRYFRDGWNLFDFAIIVLALVPATGQLALVARLARLLRVLRLVSALPELRLIVSTLVRSLPGMGHVLMLMSLIFYVYAVAGYHLFHRHDPELWGSLGLSLLTLFRVVTLEDWTDVMYTAMDMHPWSWIYFVSFVVMGTFVIINLFIAVVINNLEEAKAERLQTLCQPVSRDELFAELAATQRALSRLHERMERLE